MSELCRALSALNIRHRTGSRGERIMMADTFECAGDPVDVACPPGPQGVVEEFGFVQRNGRMFLICGDVDRRRVLESILPRVRSAIANERLRTEPDLRVRTSHTADTIQIVIEDDE